jgi:putative methionine-R-sulfoxide reductase with GAF domain
MRHSSNTITLSEEFIVEDDITEKKPAQPPAGHTHGRPVKNNSASDVAANESRGRTKLEESLTKLVRLIANVTESYTSAIFVADTKNKVLHSLAHHSLSREYVEGVQIPFGKGLVGWTAENKVRITVCPFEHDASTLLYYPCDQGLKSFIAVPILAPSSEIIGVIACDSKKNYAFPKITEKILTECAAQAQLLIDLHQANEALSSKRTVPKSEDALTSFIEKLRAATSESALFETTCSLSQSILKRDAMIALVTSNEGYGEATFYSHTPDARVEHHLMDLVCKNKKIISTERSVHVLPSDDIRARSFLSVPFHVFGKEAGALNILSAAFEPFSTNDIQILEQLAKVIGRELERHRSKAIAYSRQVGPSLLPWKHFVQKSESLLTAHPGENSLLRIQLSDLISIESAIGSRDLL